VHLTNPGAAYDHARQLFLHGHLKDSQEEAELGYKRFKDSDSALATRFQWLEAEDMLWRGMFPDAMGIFSVLTPGLADSDAKVHALSLEAIALTRLGRAAEANQSLVEAEAICARNIYTSCGEVIRSRAAIAFDQGPPGDAKRLYLESLTFAKAHHDPRLEETAYLNLSSVAMAMDFYDDAVDWSRSALRAGTEQGDENQIQSALGNLGSAYINLGDSDGASEMFAEAEKTATKIGNLRDQLYWETNAGYVYMFEDNIKAAREKFEQALKLSQVVDSKRQSAYLLVNLGLAAIQSGDAAEAEKYGNRALAMAAESGNRPDRLDAVGIKMQAAALRGDTARAKMLLGELETDPETQVQNKWLSQDALAKLYEAQSQNDAAEKEFKIALATFEAARGGIQHDASQLPFAANATHIYDDYIHFLVSRGRAEEALQAADQSRARTMAQGLAGSSKHSAQLAKADLRTDLRTDPRAIARKADATLLFYWLGEKQSYLWAITPQKTTLFSLPAQKEIEPRVERYRKALVGIDDPLQANDENGRELYRMLVAPIFQQIDTRKPVMILADGALSQLNFETLIAPASASNSAPHYWIEDATVISAPSLSMLAAAKTAQGASGRLLLMGDAVSPSADFPDLRWASLEMTKIQSHFAAPKVVAFTRGQATPEAYLQSDPGKFAYIHFVSHGTASRTDPLDSAIILSRPNAGEDSYKLYARDIIEHQIDARLVTISACNGSGIRSYAGEGLVGLSWAFLRAGAHNAIGALWEASDESTPRLMGDLYQGLEAGHSPGEALRTAKLALLHSRGKFRSPFYWAPFQLYTRL
jgi:CHAT domain-containing protein/Tfp pilus assembly protein PilF